MPANLNELEIRQFLGQVEREGRPQDAAAVPRVRGLLDEIVAELEAAERARDEAAAAHRQAVEHHANAHRAFAVERQRLSVALEEADLANDALRADLARARQRAPRPEDLVAVAWIDFVAARLANSAGDGWSAQDAAADATAAARLFAERFGLSLPAGLDPFQVA